MEYTFTLPMIIKERKLTQARVAELTGISKNGVSNLCRAGLVQIRVDTVGKLCDGLGVTPDDLFVAVRDASGRGEVINQHEKDMSTVQHVATG